MKDFTEFLYIDNSPINVQTLMSVLEAKQREGGEPKGDLRAQALVYLTIAGEFEARSRKHASISTEWVRETLGLSRSRIASTIITLRAKGLIERHGDMRSQGYVYSPVRSPVRARRRKPH
ncbi:MAG: hypothetical protein OXF88_14235 [Rhodobacteraceae bacterium]|nr:hypothetical protein [Paracoccaceae bacterium]